MSSEIKNEAIEQCLPRNETNSRIYIFRQSLLSTIALLHGACAGCVFGFSSILLPQLENSTWKFTSEQQSWIASAPTLAMIPATLVTGYAIEKLGRKKTSLISITVNFLGWLTIYESGSYQTLIFGRILSGVFAGMGYPIFLTYMGEVTNPKFRPFFLSFMPLGCTVGVFVCQLLGSFLSWKTVALCICVVPMCNILTMSFYISESHVWLTNRKRLQEASEAFTWYRGATLKAKKDFDKSVDNTTDTESLTFREKFSLCLSRSFLIPLGITSVAFMSYQFSGNIAFMFYTSTIMNVITKDPDTQYNATTILNVLRILSTMSSCVLLRVYPVRSVLIWGGYQLDLALLSLSFCLYLSEMFPDIHYLPIICLILITLSVISFAMSLGPIPAVLCGELFPAKTRGIGGALSACVSFSSLFIVVKILPTMLATFNPSTTFLFFSLCTFSGVTILFFALPNTRNKTLKEIEKLYEKPEV